MELQNYICITSLYVVFLLKLRTIADWYRFFRPSLRKIPEILKVRIMMKALLLSLNKAIGNWYFFVW